MYDYSPDCRGIDLCMGAANSVTLVVVLFLQGKLTLAEDVVVYNHTVEKGKSMRFECDDNATPPFYYYRFYSQYVKLPIAIDDSQSEYPWSVYAINASYNSLANLRIIPNVLGTREQPWKIKDVAVEFNNNIVCCQGYDDQDTTTRDDENVTISSLSAMICYHLNVQFSPQLMQSTPINSGQWISPQYPIYSQYIVISCPLEGNPPASYKWYFRKLLKDGEVDDSVEIQPYNILNITLVNNNRTLYFEFKEEHNGYYICSAENFLGNMTYSGFDSLEVKECTAFDPARPSVTINASHNLTAYVGDDLSIDCVVASLPQAADSKILRWLKNNTELKFGESAGRVYYLEGDYDRAHCSQHLTLIIKSLTFEDSGNYSCTGSVSTKPKVTDTISLTITVPVEQLAADYKQLIIKISIPVSVVIILLAISVTIGIFYYLRVRQMKLQKALEEYQRRPLPKRGDYQYEFFFAMTEDDEDKLEVDKLYVTLKQSFSIYYQLDQYLPGRTKVEMVTEGIKNSRFIIIMLSKAYLQQKDEINQLELMYTMNRIGKELTKCAFIVTLDDNLFIPYKLRHILKFPKEGADIKLKELALSSNTHGPNFIDSFPKESAKDTVHPDDIVVPLEVELLNVLSNDET